MEKVIDGTRVAPHGMFYMESAGGIPPETDEQVADERSAGCFAYEEEKGEHWTGAGATKPIVNEARPRL